MSFLTAAQSAFLGITVATVVTPGAGFVLFTTAHLAGGRRHGIAVAGGMILGACLIGLATILAVPLIGPDTPRVRQVVQVAGGGYLVWLAWLGVRSVLHTRAQSPTPALPAGAASRHGSLPVVTLGFLGSMTNPGLYVLYLAVLPAHVAAGEHWRREAAVLSAMHLGFTMFWYAFLESLLHHARHVVASRRAQRIVRLAGACALGLLGLRLLLDSLPSVALATTVVRETARTPPRNPSAPSRL